MASLNVVFLCSAHFHSAGVREKVDYLLRFKGGALQDNNQVNWVTRSSTFSSLSEKNGVFFSSNLSPVLLKNNNTLINFLAVQCVWSRRTFLHKWLHTHRWRSSLSLFYPNTSVCFNLRWSGLTCHKKRSCCKNEILPQYKQTHQGSYYSINLCI